VSYLIVVRSEAEEIEGLGGWVLLYGRRKVGKTFLLKKFLEWDCYVSVRRDLSLRVSGAEIGGVRELPEAVGAVLGKGGVVVIDEFQRLPWWVLEDLTAYHPEGRLILSGSSLGVARRVFEPRSPLLGFFTPYKLSLVRPADIVPAVTSRYGAVRGVEAAAYLRDPWLIPLYRGGDVARFVYEYSCRYWESVKALLGEVFAEEERVLTKTYEAILSLLGARVWRLSEAANILYAKGLLREPSSSHVAGFVRNLVEMDLVTSLKIYGSRRRIYRLKSSIMEAYYYLDSKYDVSERGVSYGEVEPTVELLLRQHVEDLVADLAAQYYGGRREYSLKPEIDFIVTRRGRPVATGEVKWGGYTNSDLENFRSKTAALPGLKIFVTREKDREKYKDVHLVDAEDIAGLNLPRP